VHYFFYKFCKNYVNVYRNGKNRNTKFDFFARRESALQCICLKLTPNEKCISQKWLYCILCLNRNWTLLQFQITPTVFLYIKKSHLILIYLHLLFCGWFKTENQLTLSSGNPSRGRPLKLTWWYPKPRRNTGNSM